MAVIRALDFSNPMIVSRINLERALDLMQETFEHVGTAAAKRRIKRKAEEIQIEIQSTKDSK